jgi:hypothetical protein
MSIQKKSLISTLKAAKKANITKTEASLDHAHSSVKAQPVAKLVTKAQLSVKGASKGGVLKPVAKTWD